MNEPKDQFEAQVGARVMVEPVGVGEKFATEFLGWERGRYVMLKLPSKFLNVENLHLDKVVVVKYLHSGGRICAFRSTVLALIHAPVRILFLRYPETLEVVSLRKEDRVDCFVPVVLSADGDSWEGALVNLSPGGGKLVLDARESGRLPRTGGLLALSFRLLGKGVEECQVSGRAIKAAVEGGRVVLVLVFEGVSSGTQEQIARYVELASAYLGDGRQTCPAK